MFSLSMGNEKADAGRDGRSRLARSNSQARTGTRKYSLFPRSADHEQNWQPYLVDLYSAICDDLTFEYVCMVTYTAYSPHSG